MDSWSIEPLSRPFNATIAPPGSKSLTNRALVLAALAKGDSTLANALFADDTRVMLAALQALGFNLTIAEPLHTVTVSGGGGVVPASSAELFCGNSGTTIRFLTALCTLGHGQYTLDGIERMRQRPIGPLVDLLTSLGAKIEYRGKSGYPPVAVLADGIAGGKTKYGAELSSQFLSAALMVAPFARSEVIVQLKATQTSWPYIAMTMRQMDLFGCTCELIRDPKTAEPAQLHVPSGEYHAVQMIIEPDASNATYFLAAAAAHPGATVTLRGLGTRSLQGDVGFANVLKRMGAQVFMEADSIRVEGTDELDGIEVDLAAMPDTAQTLAALAVFAKGDTVIRGLHTLRVKETDRLAALSTELTKLGAKATITGDALTITPPKEILPAAIDTYDDHRMAMSFALIPTRAPGVTINNPACVAKTYPDFFPDYTRLLQSTPQ